MKRLLIIVSIVALIAVAAVLYVKENPQNVARQLNLTPELEVTAVEIGNITERKIDVTSTFILKNPLPFKVDIHQVDYAISINQSVVVRDRYVSDVAINSGDSCVIKIPMVVLVKPLIRTLEHLDKIKADSAMYTLQATATVDLPVAGERVVKVNKVWRLPALRMLKITVADVDLEKVRWKESEMTLITHVENPNLFSLRFQSANYKVKLGKDFVMKGAIPGVTEIASRSSVNVPVTLKVKTKAVPEVLWKSTFKKRTPFELDFRCKIVSANEIVDHSSLVMVATREIDDLKKFRKAARNDAKE